MKLVIEQLKFSDKVTVALTFGLLAQNTISTIQYNCYRIEPLPDISKLISSESFKVQLTIYPGFEPKFDRDHLPNMANQHTTFKQQ